MSSNMDLKRAGILAAPMLLLIVLMLLASQFPLPYLDATLPLLPALIAVYYWSLFRPASLPLLAMLPIALLHDALYGLPLGCSLLLFVTVRLISNWLRGRMLFEQFLLVWITFAPVLTLLLFMTALCQYWVAGLPLTDWVIAYDMPFFLTWVSYPLFHLLFNWCYHQLPSRA